MRLWKKSILWFSLFLLLVEIYGFFIEPYLVSVNRIYIPLPPGWELLKGKTAVHLSDLHVRGIGRRERRISEIIERVDPDFIFLTGDYVKWEGDYASALTFLSQLKSKKGIWAVMGDYDYSNSRKSCLFCHDHKRGKPPSRSHVTFLRNSFDKVSLPGGDVWIGGIDPYGVDSISSCDDFLKGKEENPVILLSHSPLIFDHFNGDTRFLMLSGDTHGGQVWLPRWVYKFAGYEKNVKYNQGICTENKKIWYVTRGIGMSHVPLRIFRRPEINVMHVGKSQKIK